MIGRLFSSPRFALRFSISSISLAIRSFLSASFSSSLHQTLSPSASFDRTNFFLSLRHTHSEFVLLATPSKTCEMQPTRGASWVSSAGCARASHAGGRTLSARLRRMLRLVRRKLAPIRHLAGLHPRIRHLAGLHPQSPHIVALIPLRFASLPLANAGSAVTVHIVAPLHSSQSLSVVLCARVSLF